jgi:ribosomal protein S21
VQVQNFGPTHASATDTANFVAASTVVAENESDDSVLKFFESDDSRSSVVWTEESSDEDLDYFAALDVAAAEASPRVMDAEVFPGPSVGRRRRRAVAKRRVSEVEGGRLRVDRAGKRELLFSPVGPSVGEGEL